MKSTTQTQIRFTALAYKWKNPWDKKILNAATEKVLWDGIFIDFFHLGTMRVRKKRKRETDVTLILYDVYKFFCLFSSESDQKV